MFTDFLFDKQYIPTYNKWVVSGGADMKKGLF